MYSFAIWLKAESQPPPATDFMGGSFEEHPASTIKKNKESFFMATKTEASLTPCSTPGKPSIYHQSPAARRICG